MEMIWLIGAAFTFALGGETNKGWLSAFEAIMCLFSWPFLLGSIIKQMYDER